MTTDEKPKLDVAIATVVSVAKNHDGPLEELSNALRNLVTPLDEVAGSALAFIAETASTSCRTGVLDPVSCRIAVLDLCERIIAATQANGIFSFENLESDVEALLFPPELSIPDKAKPSERAVSATDSLEVACDPLEGLKTPTNAGGDDLFEMIEMADCDLLGEFLTEAQEHIEIAEQLLLAVERDPSNSESILGLFRAIHSLKGSSGVLDLTTFGEVAHHAESILVRARDGVIELRGPIFDLVLMSVDFMAQLLVTLKAFDPKQKLFHAPLPPDAFLEQLISGCHSGVVNEITMEEIRAVFDQRKRIWSEAVSLDSSQTDIASNHVQAKPRAGNNTSRVDSSRLEYLVDLIGELVITETAVQRELQRHHNFKSESLASRLQKTVRELQELSLSLKMVPVGSMLHKLNRLVRDVSIQLNKPCRLLIEGGDTEIDKTLLECVADPLVHLIRNSLDHGVELCPADRVANGKPKTASIIVSAEHRGGKVLIRISDDGRGLDRQKILANAIEKGIVDSDEELTNNEIDQLIFQSGLSTAQTVNELSGRGVGMDVVRKNIESLRGNVSITSTFGVGTEILLELPLTLSIIDGTVVRVGKQTFVVPTLSIIEQVQTAKLEVTTTGNQKMARFRDRYVALGQLGDWVGTPHSASTVNGQVCLFVESGTKSCGIIVDKIVGQQPIVIKPVGGVLESFDSFAGGALLSDGQVAFVLDLHTLCVNQLVRDRHLTQGAA